MKPSRFTEEQIIGILREQEAGAKTADVYVEHREIKSQTRAECNLSKETRQIKHGRLANFCRGC